MNWYLTKIVFRIICGAGNHTSQFDEQLRIIQAADLEQACQKARELGMKEQDRFFNTQQQLVQWKFIGIPEIYRLNDLIHGAEFYSRIHEEEYPDQYIDIIYKKAEQLRFDNTLEMLNLA